jgi:hypothetical protein
MKKTVRILGLLLIVILFSCSEDKVDVLRYGTITGRVVEANSFEPIENSKVSISPTNNTVFSDIDGYFIIPDVEEGDYSVSAEKEDYLTAFEPVTVSYDVDVNVIFEMEEDDFLNRPPSTPILKTPIEGVENQEISVELAWSSIDPDEDEIIFKVELKNDYDNSKILIDQLIDTNYVVSNLRYGVKYFWQVTASDDINNEVLSTIGTFKTKINPENRYLFVRQNSNGNNIIYSSNFDENDPDSLTELQLTDVSKNSWRPRANRASNLIAFLRNENNQTHIFTMETNGSNIRQVTSAVSVNGYDLNEIDYAWSSNGDRFLYSNYDKLYMINKDGSGLKMIYQTPDGSFISECDWSNDESIIALKTNNIKGYNVSIYTIDLLGNRLTTILSSVKGAAGGINISVNNKLLLYTYDISEYENANNRQLDTHIFIYQFLDGSILDMSSDKPVGFNDIDPRFSPNESEIIFTNTSNDGMSSKSIFKIGFNVNEGEVINRTLMYQDAFMPDWE